MTDIVRFSVRAPSGLARCFENPTPAANYALALIRDGWPASVRSMETGRTIMTEDDLRSRVPTTPGGGGRR